MLKQESSYIWFMRFFYIFLALLGFSTQLTAQKMFVAESSSTALEEDSSSIHKLYIRPFITDDARVVGKKLAQLESWVRFDKEAGQHWLLGAYGPNKKLEITVGGVYGYQNEHNSKKTFAYALPLLQAKFLFKEYKPNKGPGLGMAVGTFLPVGQGSFKPDGYGTFGYFIVSQCFGKGSFSSMEISGAIICTLMVPII